MNELGPVDTSGNGSFTGGGALQHLWDSTSLGALKQCPRYYELSIVRGYAPRALAVDLRFGLLLHGARERFYRARAQGTSHDDALLASVTWLLCETYDTEAQRPWASDHPQKNRLTLVRTFVWYADQWKDDPLETIMLANGAPAVELTFRFPTDYVSPSGTNLELGGHLDRMVRFQGEIWDSDLKSTKSTLNQDYFAQFTPDNQFSLYSFASRHVYDLPARGVIIDAAQVAVTFSRFARGIVARSADQLDEWYGELGTWLEHATSYAQANHWPQNDKACFRCSFRSICARPASVRRQWLETDFQRRVWDPSIARGDI